MFGGMVVGGKGCVVGACAWCGRCVVVGRCGVWSGLLLVRECKVDGGVAPR